jgi:hypothetical protein
MQTASILSSINIGGLRIQSSINRSAEGVLSDVVGSTDGLTNGIPGAFDTASGGVDGLPTGHGLAPSNVVDLYWLDADGNPMSNRGQVVNVASTNAVTFSGGSPSGDTLPADDTVIYVGLELTINRAFNGDKVEVLAAMATYGGVVSFWTVSTEVLAVKLAPPSGSPGSGGEAYVWQAGQAITNPLAGQSITKIVVSNVGQFDGGVITVAELISA